MIRRYAYLRDEGFTMREAVHIVNAETGYSHVRLLAGPPGPVAPANRSERIVEPLTGLLICRLAIRLALIVSILAGMWVYGQIA